MTARGVTLRRLLLGLAAVAFVSVPAVSQAQGLAEAAAKEREKRKGQKAPKVLTEDDLRRAGQSGNANVDTGAPAPPASPAPGAAPAAAAGAETADKKEKSAEEQRAEQEKAWRDKLQKAQQQVQELSARADKIQGYLNDLSGNVYGSQRTGLLNELQKTQGELKQAQQQVADLQEEGRRNSFRP